MLTIWTRQCLISMPRILQKERELGQTQTLFWKNAKIKSTTCIAMLLNTLQIPKLKISKSLILCPKWYILEILKILTKESMLMALHFLTKSDCLQIWFYGTKICLQMIKKSILKIYSVKIIEILLKIKVQAVLRHLTRILDGYHNKNQVKMSNSRMKIWILFNIKNNEETLIWVDFLNRNPWDMRKDLI